MPNVRSENGREFRKLNEIFEAACDLPTGDQAEFLRLQCGTDLGLLSEAERLISASKRVRSNSFLESDAFAVSTRIFANADRDAGIPLERIGSYNIVSEIGRGGMGVVYLATRNDFQRLAAIKVIKRGMDTDEIFSRFRQERDVLASLDHPNIARLLDGGTTENGQPYLVMEFVDGTPIKDHCDANELGLNERLSLFLKVCGAVSYAHKHLTVHRDIKPSNILVTGEGEPKLLDFGIAKILSEGEDVRELTAPSERLFTPEYASPEQIVGNRITTSSDVYGLGILLYELLTGHRPFETGDLGHARVAEMICSIEPRPPSSWMDEETGDGRSTNRRTIRTSGTGRPMHSLLRGDLDNIILTALRKDADRRYASVDEFAKDIRRYIDGMPVLAHPATWIYKARKFVSRNRAATAAAAIAMISILAGGSVATWKAIEANRERAAAERRFNAVRQLANSLVTDFNDAEPATAVKLRDISTEYLEKLAAESNDPELLLELGDANLKLAQSTAYFLIDEEKAARSLTNAEQIARRLLSSDTRSVAARLLLLNVLAKRNEFWSNRDLAIALNNDSQRIAIYEELRTIEPDNPEHIRELGRAVRQYGTLLRELGRDIEAAPYFARAAEAFAEYTERPLPDEERLWALNAQAANIRNGLNEPVRAAEMIRNAVASAPGRDEKGLSNVLVSLGAELSQSYFDAGAYADSIDAGVTAVEAAKVADPEARSAFLVRNRYDTLILIGHAQLKLGQREQAMASTEKAIALRRQWAAQKSNSNHQQSMSHGYFFSGAGRLLLEAGRRDLAKDAFAESEKALLSVLAGIPNHLSAKQMLADVYFQMGAMNARDTVCTAATGPITAVKQRCALDAALNRVPGTDVDQALSYYRKALSIQETLSFETGGSPRYKLIGELLKERIGRLSRS